MLHQHGADAESASHPCGLGRALLGPRRLRLDEDDRAGEQPGRLDVRRSQLLVADQPRVGLRLGHGSSLEQEARGERVVRVELYWAVPVIQARPVMVGTTAGSRPTVVSSTARR